MPTALTIAGSDSGGGAGIAADLKVFSALGVYGTCAITAVTAQNTRGVTAQAALEPSLVAAQIRAVLEDIGAAAVKTGMLANGDIVGAVAQELARWRPPHLVVDPVVRASTGAELLTEQALEALKRQLLPLAEVITPNLPEAEALVGRALTSEADIRDAAREMLDLGCRAVVVKGGHRSGPADDVLFDGQAFDVLHAERLDAPFTHGTGCTFSAALTAELAKGADLFSAARSAKVFVTEAIRHGFPIGQGHAPVHHLWNVWPA
ncbi:MAG: bifunctional hydroxymethylpyrimidine kinase/phosphomethylpyrimidine kinase [Chloroflexota bacterium]